MELGYRLIFCGRSIYNEVDIQNELALVGIGTIAGCKARFSRDIFNQDFLVLISRSGTGWHVQCKAGVYIDGDGTPYAEAEIQQGDLLPIHSCRTREELFKLACQVNYEGAPKTYDACIDMRGRQQVLIGNTGAENITLAGISGGEEEFKLENAGSYLRLAIVCTELGVYLNGNRAVGITKIKNQDFISCGEYSFYFCDGYLYYTNSGNVLLHGLTALPILESRSALEYPKFNRSTRVKEVLPEEPISILDPPDIPKKPADNLLMTLLPAVATLVLVIVLRGVMGGGGAYVLFSVCTMTLGIVTSILNYRRSRKEYKTSLQERETVYNDYLARKSEEIAVQRGAENEMLQRIYPAAAQTIARIDDFAGSLFDRTLADEDFLHIRLGLGSRTALRRIVYKQREALVLGDELQMAPERIAAENETLTDAPIVVDLKKAGILGIVGREANTEGLLKAIIEDICSRQFPTDVTLFAVCTEEQAAAHEWMRFIPHFQKDSGLLRNIACDKESCDIQFEYLFKTLSLRESLPQGTVFPAIVVFVLDQNGLYTHPVSHYLETAGSLGVYFIFLADAQEKLPLYCGNLILVPDDAHATLIDTKDRTDAVDFRFDRIPDQHMWRMALKLAPVYCESVSVEGDLPKSFSLFSLLGIQGADDLDLAARWKRADITKTMAAPLGLRSGGEVISLDLHEKYHGPHGLVAGTTGSGKSEILQTYILSMATLYPPDELGFVIIDFKGGGMANLFADLPHLIGAITDIDGKAIDRSLMSIRAEIDKRKRLFAEAEVNNIGDYITRHRAQDPNAQQPLPHLILIIDEFAELKADQPEFMKEVISAARVGRSLGLHLILATQKPAGVIDDQIWSNSRFKLCLKVQNKGDSNEVLHSPLAAEIREPGRAYLQVGNNEIFELFQSAYSGGPAQSEEMDHVRPFELFEVDSCGRKRLIYAKKDEKQADGEAAEQRPATQLEAITNKVAQYCREAGIERLPSICMPPLSGSISFPARVRRAAHGTGQITAPLGYYDDPSTQSQNVVEIDFASNNLLLIGSSQTGKTNLLMTVIRGLAEAYTPQEVNFYILDFGPSILGNFKALPHVGGVVNDSDDEKLKNLFKLLNSEMNLRRQKIMAANVSSFAAYREAGYTDLPLIVVAVDNFTALRELYLANEDALLPICRNGISAGISVIIANQNMQGLGFRYLASFAKRIALHCNDANDYASIIDYCRIRPDDVPGRGVISIDKTVYEMQVYSCFDGEKEKDKVEAQLAFIAGAQAAAGGMRARAIPMAPDDLTLPMLLRAGAAAANELCFGLDYDEIAPVRFDLGSVGAFGTVGKPGPAAQAVLKSLMQQLNTAGRSCDLYLVDSLKRDLAPYQAERNVTEYTADANRLAEIVTAIHAELHTRAEECAARGREALAEKRWLVVCANGSDNVNALCKNNAALSLYKEILDRYADMRVCFVFINLDNAEVGYSSPEVLKRLRDTKAILFFEPLQKLKFLQVSQSTLRQSGKLQPNDGYCFTGGDAARFKIAIP